MAGLFDVVEQANTVDGENFAVVARSAVTGQLVDHHFTALGIFNRAEQSAQALIGRAVWVVCIPGDTNFSRFALFEFSIAGLHSPLNHLADQQPVGDIERVVLVAVGVINFHAASVKILNEPFAAGTVGVGLLESVGIGLRAPDIAVQGQAIGDRLIGPVPGLLEVTTAKDRGRRDQGRLQGAKNKPRQDQAEQSQPDGF